MEHASGLIESEGKNIEPSTAESNAYRRADVINNNGTTSERKPREDVGTTVIRHSSRIVFS